MPTCKKAERLSDALNLWDDFKKFSVPLLDDIEAIEARTQTELLFRDCEKKLRAYVMSEVRDFTYSNED